MQQENHRKHFKKTRNCNARFLKEFLSYNGKHLLQ